MKTALCHGTFDLLHPGHMMIFSQAHLFADRVIVTVTADEFVKKGNGRPVNRQSDRAFAITGCKYVDGVEICFSDSALPMIEKYRPDIFIKGGDYKTQDKLGNLEAERKAVESYGGRVVFVPHSGHSTTEIIERIRGHVGTR